jgi:hypothetical protein
MVHIVGRGSLLRVVEPIMVNVLDEFMNPWVNIIDDLHEKVEQT